MNSDNAITVKINDQSFAYDVRSLLRAFFGHCTISFIDNDDADITIVVRDGHIALEYKGNVIKADADGDRSLIKNTLKLMLYDTIKEDVGYGLPWGGLTGIRPVKLVMKKLNEGAGKKEIIDFMAEQYRVSEKRASLSYDIALREKRLISEIPEDSYSLYIGIPFCPSICLYCSFSSYPIAAYRHRTDEYLAALFSELDAAAELLKHRPPVSVYIGGGTPTSLSAGQLSLLMDHVKRCFDLSGLKEWTVEAGRPDSITRDKLAAIREHGDIRISINPQTFNQKTLDTIGRAHTVLDVYKAYDTARSLGFSCINMDLIVGLPGERAQELQETLSQVIKLSPDNLTVHSLALKRASRLSEELKNYDENSFFQTINIMDMVYDAAASMGMAPYYLYRQKDIAGNLENTGFAPPGKEGLYNILIMEEVQDIIACGAGAVSKRVYGSQKPERTANVKDVAGYIDRIDEMIERKRKLWE